ncbi:2,5-didehydrogluconate reductase DkgB [Craterilacuibacter sinensis]|uniref:2,5-didehydrogluconate reductase DkgB n=1 Tax=Craterilacuibacter sinensis TaxID=2686017 RepID=A0A845BUC2_9NEIS|nr:2,5-didehydrogluconate reductase DkgB [Craterilacuibacter sinensis]MXR36133.1 2,5-didehydrogluconate reductase DkgB [Craterilacuibacter sinensis]
MGIPAIGVGTFRLKGQTVIDSVTQALSLGYRAIDTAQIYDNEADIGQAIRASGLSPDALFITSKVWVDSMAPGQLQASLRESADKLGVDRLDLALIHWPAPNGPVRLEDSVEALADAQAQGLTRLIGVSNFNIADTTRALSVVGPAGLATNQIELSPYVQSPRLVRFLQSQGVHVTSYMTLAYGQVMQDAVLQGIAARHAATVAQVTLAWAMQQGFSVIPSSTRAANLQSNLAASELVLDEEDMAAIARLNRQARLATPPGIASAWDD